MDDHPLQGQQQRQQRPPHLPSNAMVLRSLEAYQRLLRHPLSAPVSLPSRGAPLLHGGGMHGAEIPLPLAGAAIAAFRGGRPGTQAQPWNVAEANAAANATARALATLRRGESGELVRLQVADRPNDGDGGTRVESSVRVMRDALTEPPRPSANDRKDKNDDTAKSEKKRKRLDPSANASNKKRIGGGAKTPLLRASGPVDDDAPPPRSPPLASARSSPAAPSSSPKGKSLGGKKNALLQRASSSSTLTASSSASKRSDASERDGSTTPKASNKARRGSNSSKSSGRKERPPLPLLACRGGAEAQQPMDTGTAKENRKILKKWHDKKAHYLPRRNMVSLIERHIRQVMENPAATNGDAGAPTTNLARPAKLAQALESRLYDNAPSYSAYLDVSTLHERLRLLCVVVGRKIEHVRNIARSTQQRTGREGDANARKARHRILRNRLGDALYDETIELMDTVESIRLRHGADPNIVRKKRHGTLRRVTDDAEDVEDERTKALGKERAAREIEEETESPPPATQRKESTKEDEDTTSARDALAEPFAAFFFDDMLSKTYRRVVVHGDAMPSYTSDQGKGETVETIDWKGLISRTKSHIRSYREWLLSRDDNGRHMENSMKNND